MQVKTIVAVTTSIILASTVTFFSCGESDKGSSPKTKTPLVTEEFKVEIDGASVTVPPYAFDAETQVRVLTGATPSLFMDQDDTVQAADLAAELTGESGSGSELSEAKLALTMVLDVQDTAKLLGVDAKPEDLCVFAVNHEGQGLVWRRAAFKELDATGKKVTILTKWLGVYQLFYCGASPLEGLVDVDAGGTELLVVAEPTEPASL